MTKEEYLNRLRDLLSGMGADDQMDALLFYRAYFEDAGEGMEEQVMKELGSPEEVARKILSEQKFPAAIDETGSDTDTDSDAASNFQSGYADAKASDSQSGYTDATDSGASSEKNGLFKDWTFYQEHKSGCIIVAILIAICTLPVWGGVLGGLFGIVVGFVGILIGIFVALFSLCIGCFVGGIACIIAGITILLPSAGIGLFVIGIGCLLLALSALSCVLSGLLCFRFVPWVIRSISGLFHKSTPKMGGASA